MRYLIQAVTSGIVNCHILVCYGVAIVLLSFGYYCRGNSQVAVLKHGVEMVQKPGVVGL